MIPHSKKYRNVIVIALVLILIAIFFSSCGKGDVELETAGKAPPPWFAADPATCQLTETSAQSRGDPHSFDDQGNSTGLLPQGQVTCVLEIQACADMIVKHQVINTSAGEKCPEYLHFSYAPNTKVCCESWNEAKVSKSPCDPLEDLDCDGIENNLDEYPLDFSKP